MKQLRADKCKDGYLITITDRILVGSATDVLKVIRENGLILRKELSHKPTMEDKNIWIYAD